MKAIKLINALTVAALKYQEKYNCEPHIFSICPDEGILLCSNVIKNGCLRRAKKPYMRIKIKEFQRML